MFLYIFEDNTFWQMGSEISEEDKQSCADGFLDIFRVNNGLFKFWSRDKWHLVEMKPNSLNNQ